MLRVVHFEIIANDLGRAAEFYKRIFNWEIEEWKEGEGDLPEYWLVTNGLSKEGQEVSGGIFRPERSFVDNGDLTEYRCTIGVPSLDEYIAKVTDGGGTVIRPKALVVGSGWLAFCKDTEGNIFGMMQNDMFLNN